MIQDQGVPVTLEQTADYLGIDDLEMLIFSLSVVSDHMTQLRALAERVEKLRKR